MAANEDKPALACLVGPPRPLNGTFDQHVDALDDEPLVVSKHRNNAFHPQYIGPKTLNDTIDPGNEFLGFDRLIEPQRQATDLIVVFMIVILTQKFRLDRKNAIEVESVPAEHFAEIDAALLGAVDLGVGIRL